MYYIQKSKDGYYISDSADNALFSIDKLPECLPRKAGHMVSLVVDEAQQKVWYEYIKIDEQTTESRLTALEENKADKNDLTAIAEAIERGLAL